MIGALVASAFVVYDRWKTTELQRYEDARAEVDEGFKRAEFVKELVPIVVDAKRDVQVRAQALAALINTRSISEQAAVNLNQQLLLSDVLAAGYSVEEVNPVNGEIHEYYVAGESQKDFLLATMTKVMPAGITAVMANYSQTLARVNLGALTSVKTRDTSKDRAILDRAAGFWMDLVTQTIATQSDTDLEILNSDSWLADHLPQLDRMVRTPTPSEAERWAARDNKGVRLVGSIRAAETNRDHGLANASLEAAMMSTSSPESADIGRDAIELLKSHAIVSSKLAATTLRIVLSQKNLAPHPTRPEEKHNPFDARVRAAADYLVWSGQFPQVARELEGPVLDRLRPFGERLATTPESALEYGTNYPTEWTLIQFLLTSNSASNDGPDQVTQTFLTSLFAVSDGKLDRAGLKAYRKQWRDANTIRLLRKGDDDSTRPAAK